LSNWKGTVHVAEEASTRILSRVELLHVTSVGVSKFPDWNKNFAIDLSLSHPTFFIAYLDVNRTAPFLPKMKSFAAAAAAAFIALTPSVMGLTVNTPSVCIKTVAWQVC
jgi:hypothetical protein